MGIKKWHGTQFIHSRGTSNIYVRILNIAIIISHAKITSCRERDSKRMLQNIFYIKNRKCL
jgi:hypothetical protein